MKYCKILLSIIMGVSLSMSSCTGKESTNTQPSINSSLNNDSLLNNQSSIADLNPDEMIFLVEGAVDSWFFYHLHDYRSYEPIIRSTEYDDSERCFIHKCRYRASTLGGGYETEEKIFKVTFDIDPRGIKDFNVVDITGKKSLTEKED